MKKIILALLTTLSIAYAVAQDLQNEIGSAIAEGKTIYKLESANKLSNLLFPEKYKGKEPMVGNITYLESDNVRSVFYGKGDKPKVLASFVFDAGLNEKNAQIDLAGRDMTGSELELFMLRNSALKVIQDANSFHAPANAKLTVIPMAIKGENKVFVITEPKQAGTVIFGNDYQLNFDDKYTLLEKTPLHKTMASITYEINGGSTNDKVSSHVHVAEKGDMLTATDIAILLLNQKSTGWTNHTFISEKYIYFWNYATMELKAIPKGDPKSK